MANELNAQAYEQMENPLQYFEDVSNGTNPMTRATPAYAPYTSTAGYRDLGGSAPFMDPALLKRPARKQVSNRSYFEDHASDGQDYNIWYHKRPGYRQDKFEDRENPGTRCNVLTDAGKTKATKKSPFCIYFAQGRCSLGSDCMYHHRIPTFEDEDRHDMAHDIFGRERHATDREDMSGVGNFTRECRTLYVGCVKMSGNIEESIKRHFEEWGPIEYSRAIHTKSIAFVRYYLRASAEFAKEAMNNQSLDNNDVLMLRWATDDTNPIAKEYEEKRKHVIASDALNKRLKIMDAADQATMYYQITGQYPDTDRQFAEQQNAAYSYEFAGYSTDHTNEQHPYASIAAARRAAMQQNQAAGQAGLDSTAAGAYQYNPSDPYGYYYQYYADAYAAAPPTAAQVTTEFAPMYRTAADVLDAQEEEEERAKEREEARKRKKEGEQEGEKVTPALPPGMGGVKHREEKQEEKKEEKKEGDGEKKEEGGDDLQSFYDTLNTGEGDQKAKESENKQKEAENKEKEKGKETGKASNTKVSAKKASDAKGQIRKDSTVKRPNKK